MNIALQDEVDLQRVSRQNIQEEITVRYERIARSEKEINNNRELIWCEGQEKKKFVRERNRIDTKIEALKVLQETIQSPEVRDLAK
jgi:hypothetical protein